MRNIFLQLAELLVHLDGILEAHLPQPSLYHSAAKPFSCQPMPHIAVQLGWAKRLYFCFGENCQFSKIF